MRGDCERCHDRLYLFPMGGRFYCATCFSDRRRRLTLAYRGPERRHPGGVNPDSWSRRWDDLSVRPVAVSSRPRPNRLH